MLRSSHVRRCLKSIGKPLDKITRQDVMKWMSTQKWGRAARASARASLRTFWAWAVATGATASSPMAGVPPVRQLPGVPKPMPDAVVMVALSQAPPEIALAIEVMAVCGLRRAECACLRACDIEPVGQGWMLRVVGKGGRTRMVPCPPLLARKLKARGGWVFPGAQQGHISPGWLGKLISRYLPPGWTPHALRHRYASVAYATGHDIRAVQHLLGHASVATTQMYIALDDSAVREAASGAWNLAS